MTFAQRVTAPLFGWIPDLSVLPARRRLVIGVTVSLLLHLLAFLLFPVIVARFTQTKPKISFARDRMRPREIELQIVPPEEPPATPFTLAPEPERLFMDSRGLDIARDAAENPLFESDENMRAASENPATGDVPLPSQAGKMRPFNAFQTQRSLLGAAARPFAPEVPPLQVTPPVPPPAPKVAQQTPPAPVPAPDKPAEKAPKAGPDLVKPSKLREVDQVQKDEIALSKKEAQPTAVTQIQAVKTTPPPASHAAVLRPIEDKFVKLTTPVPKPQPPRESGYQPEQEQNHIEGSISNRGKAAVDALATPMAKYRKQVNDAIGSRWYYYIRQRMDLIAFGSVRISFLIDAQGHVSATRVDSNTSNQSLADVSLRAVRDAEIAPPPNVASATMSHEPLEWSLTFTYYPFSQ